MGESKDVDPANILESKLYKNVMHYLDSTVRRKQGDEAMPDMEKEFRNICSPGNVDDKKTIEIGGETLLHVLMKCLPTKETKTEKKVVLNAIELYPKMITHKCASDGNKGQTPLHIGICRRHMPLVEQMLKCRMELDRRRMEQGQEQDWCRLDLYSWYSICATGSNFEKTAMLGQLPLSVAALTLDTGL